MRVACVGDFGVDRYLDSGLVRPGGCSLNLAVNLARLAANFEVQAVSAVGTDADAEVVLKAVAAERLTPLLRQLSGSTPCQSLRLSASGERSFVGYEAGVLAGLSLDAEQQEVVKNSDIVVSLIYTQFEASLRRLLALPRRGALVLDFMDLSDYGHKLESLAFALDSVALGFFGLTDPHSPVIAELQRRTKERNQSFVVTLGAEGSLYLDGGRRAFCRAVPVARVVDTTGAGDAFAAAFLSRFLAGAGVEGALAFASQHAAGIVQRIGGF